jgi:hypothetical protein
VLLKIANYCHHVVLTSTLNIAAQIFQIREEVKGAAVWFSRYSLFAI